MYDELDKSKVRAGHIVQYGEEYHAAAIVRVKNRWRTSGGMRTYSLFVLEPIFGPVEFGDVFQVATRADGKHSHYVNWKFKKPGDQTEYVVGDHKQLSEKLSGIKERYMGKEFFAKHELKWINIPND
jgi:hypothetical protein